MPCAFIQSSACKSILHGWKTALGLFLQTLFYTGTIKSIGVYFSEMQESLGTTGTGVGLILGLFSGFSFGAGPFVAYFYRNDIGRRYLFVTGAVLSSLGLILGSLVSTSRQLASCLSLAGIGGCILSVCCVLTMQEKNAKNFQLLFGLGKSGNSIGMILVPLLANYLMSIYGWRGSMMIIGALVGNIIPLTMLIEVEKSVGNEPYTVSLVEDEPTEGQIGITKCYIHHELRMSDDEKGILEHENHRPGTEEPDLGIKSHGPCTLEPLSMKTGTTLSVNKDKNTPNQNTRSFKAPFSNIHQRIKDITSHLDPWMSIFIVADTFGGMVSSGWPAFLIPRAVSSGIPLYDAIYLLYPASIACFLGRFLSGILKTKRLSTLDTFLIIKFLDVSSLIVDILVPIYALKFVTTFVNAFCIAEANMLVVYICKEHTLPSFFPFIYALLLVLHGTGNIIGTYLAGMIADLTGNYNASYMLLAAFNGVILCLTIPLRYFSSRYREVS